jgi:hypothetical protein
MEGRRKLTIFARQLVTNLSGGFSFWLLCGILGSIIGRRGHVFGHIGH